VVKNERMKHGTRIEQGTWESRTENCGLGPGKA
jgi:hypothetical protein